MFDEIFRARAHELWNLYLATGLLDHRGEKGKFREAFVKQLIEAFLPKRYGIGSGVIIDSAGQQSPQADIIIFDVMSMPPILERDGQGVYPIDSVLRVIEVKSVADKAALDQFSRLVWALSPFNESGLKVASPGRLPNQQAYYPLCCFFAFTDTYSDVAKRIEGYQEFMKNPVLFCVDLIFYSTRSCKALRYDDRFDCIKIFLAALLARIQEAANSRAEFEPRVWFGI